MLNEQLGNQIRGYLFKEDSVDQDSVRRQKEACFIGSQSAKVAFKEEELEKSKEEHINLKKTEMDDYNNLEKEKM
ncbi:MAG: hypothetical protein GY820_17665 [Gammaproteobacteria bacterium]|nr:hypothetical protein [Gammaproteobacteria bacterium]